MPLADDDTLLDHLDVTDDDHVLLIGDDTLDLMCAVLRRGCGAVMVMRPQDGARPEPVELVVVPDLADMAAANAALALARRALAPQGGTGGRVVLRLPQAAGRVLVRAVAATLRAQGFGRLRQVALADATVLLAELPCFWTPCAGSLVAARAL